MNKQINIRLPQNMLEQVKYYSDSHGYGSIQEFIKETIREKIFGDELELVRKLIEVSDRKKLYGTEKELFDKLKR